VAIGRKNWLFVGSELGGETAATLFGLIGSARLHEIEPWLYLRDVLGRIAAVTRGDLDDLLPDRWKLAHPEAHLPLNR
jgi:transposase